MPQEDSIYYDEAVELSYDAWTLLVNRLSSPVYTLLDTGSYSTPFHESILKKEWLCFMPILPNPTNTAGFLCDKCNLMIDALKERIKAYFPEYTFGFDLNGDRVKDTLKSLMTMSIHLQHPVLHSVVVSLHNIHELIWMNDDELKNTIQQAITKQVDEHRKAVAVEMFKDFSERMHSLRMGTIWRLRPGLMLADAQKASILSSPSHYEQIVLEICIDTLHQTYVSIAYLYEAYDMTNDELSALIAQKCDQARRESYR